MAALRNDAAAHWPALTSELEFCTSPVDPLLDFSQVQSGQLYQDNRQGKRKGTF
jgi:hypothetical protein